MKRLLAILCVVVLMAACEPVNVTITPPKPPVYGPEDTVENVLCAYFMGSNNLSQALLRNIEQMEIAVAEGALNDSRILVFIDRYVGSSIYELVDKGGECSRTMLKNYNDIDCTDPEVMRTVLTDMKNLAPARHYGFVFGGHATGWVLDSLDILEKNSATILWAGDESHTALPTEHHGLWMKRYGEDREWKTRALGYDNGAGSKNAGMDVAELADALAVLYPDFVLFDACFMASVEALWELRTVTDYCIASPIEIMSQGFPYTPIVHSLFDNWTDLAAVCKKYIDSYQNSSMPNAAVSLVDMAHLDDVAAAVADVVESARDVERAWLDNVDSLQYYEGLTSHVFYDLAHTIERVATDPEALSRFEEAMERAVLWEGHTEWGYSDFCRGEFALKRSSGLSVYIPRQEFSKFREAYMKLPWTIRAGVIE